jgi:translation elongation factor EF-Ts
LRCCDDITLQETKEIGEMANVNDNPAFVARQAELKKTVSAAIKRVEDARQEDLADVVNSADGDAMSVAEALQRLESAE